MYAYENLRSGNVLLATKGNFKQLINKQFRAFYFWLFSFVLLIFGTILLLVCYFCYSKFGAYTK